MRQMKKKIIIAIIVTLLLTATIAYVISHLVIKEKNEQIQMLQAQVVDTKCLAFANDLEADSIITQEDIIELDIKLANISSGTYKVINGNSTNAIHYTAFVDENGNEQKSEIRINREDLIGRVVKSNVSKNTLIQDSLLYAKGEEPTKDERIQEFNFLQIPSDLVENDYVDVRIQFPTGEDYSVLIGKKVEKIAGENTIFIKMNEEEIMAMGSAIIEAYMQKGVRLYANKYTDPATQLFNEAIVDYVAKYEYAVEKLIAEKEELELRKELVKLLSEDGKLTIPVGTKLDASGDVATAETIVDIATIEDEEGTKLVKVEALELIPEEIKESVKLNIEEIKIEDLEDEILAEYAGIKKDYIEEIKLASIEENENILNYYRIMRVETRDSIIRSYPVREEVLAVVRNNPNLLETIKAEFDATALLNTRIDEYKELEAQYNAAYDEYTKQEIKQKMDELVDERIENVEQSLKSEIEAQRAERVSYLESLIDG